MGSLFANSCVREQFCSVLFVTSNLTNIKGWIEIKADLKKNVNVYGILLMQLRKEYVDAKNA